MITSRSCKYFESMMYLCLQWCPIQYDEFMLYIRSLTNVPLWQHCINTEHLKNGGGGVVGWWGGDGGVGGWGWGLGGGWGGWGLGGGGGGGGWVGGGGGGGGVGGWGGGGVGWGWGGLGGGGGGGGDFVHLFAVYTLPSFAYHFSLTCFYPNILFMLSTLYCHFP